MNTLPNAESRISRNRLLATVSSLALIISVGGIEPSLASDKPSIWIEYGWDFENIRDSASDFGVPLGPTIPQGFTPFSQKLGLARSYSDEGKITFQPDGSDWVFSASVRYGRSKGKKSRVNQTLAPIPTTSFATYIVTYSRFPSYNRSWIKHIDQNRNKLSAGANDVEGHLILDFQAGKDVGIGLFGRGSTSTLSGGVRFAHFNVSRHTSANATQGVFFTTTHHTTQRSGGVFAYQRERWDLLSMNGGESQHFGGIGPAIQWNASARLWGDSQDAISFDWGANAALLFGRQKKKIYHQSATSFGCYGRNCPVIPPTYTNHGDVRTSKNITVPNVGGFAGFSINDPNLKISFGYRADLFMNAVDVGLDTRKSSNLLFHGPYASVSIGLGN